MKERVMEKEKRVTRRWRTAAVLAAGIAIGVVMVATPAASHIGGVFHLWNNHIKPKADARYDRVLTIQNAGVGAFNQTTYTSIGGGTYKAAGRCALIMDGTFDWDDNGGANILFVQWHVDGAPVGGDFAYQGGGTGNNFAASATAVTVVGPGSHSVQLRAFVTTGSVDIEDLGAYAMCAHRRGNGTVVTPREVARPASGSSSDATQ
jgi:hypothetical protein